MLDCFDGSIQGFQMANHMRAELCVEAFENACRKSGARGMILHYISYYNLRRITSVNDGLPPLVYRRQYLEAAMAHSA